MATYNYTGTTGADSVSLLNFYNDKPPGGDVININGLDGNDTFYLNSNGKTSYNTPFQSAGFTVSPVNASGVIVVTGASTGGTKFTFNLTSVETLVFADKTVTLSYLSADTIAPTVTTFSPADAATGIAIGSNIVLTFSEAIQKGTTGTITIHSGSATGTVVESYAATNTTNLTVSGNTLTINPTANLANGTQYFVTIDSGAVKDLAGNNYAGTTTYDFTTLPDTIAPTVSTFSPADAATGVAIGSNIVLTFSEAIQKGTTGTITIHSGSATGTVVESYAATNTTNLTVSGNTLTINPTADLAYGTQYFVTIDPGAVKDLAGNNYTGTTTYDFTTAAAPDTTAPTVTTYSPADAATGIAIGSNIVLTFSEAIQKGTTGTIAIHSGSAGGTVVESYAAANTANLSVSGNTLTINPTADLANGTQYFVTIDPGAVKDLAGNNYAGTTTYDFTTLPDTIAPTVSTFSPADAATGVAIGSNIVLTFSEAIQQGTTGTIAIHSGSAGGAVLESYAATNTSNLSVSGNTLTINPTASLAYGTQYFVTIDSGAVKDLAGNNYAGTTTYDFTTAAAPDTTAPTVTTFSPADAATGIAIGSNIVLTFSEAIQQGATGTIAIHSGSAGGAVLESYAATNTTNLSVSGNTLTINPTSTLAYGTQYFVTIDSGSIRDVAGNNYAGTTTYDFTTLPDTAPPTVTTFSPSDAATGIDVGSNIVLTFSEAIQKGAGKIEIHSGSASGTLLESYDAASNTANLSVSGNTLTINPTANLANSTHYFVVLGNASIKDLAGNSYAGASDYDFTTADPYAASGSSGGGSSVAILAGVGALGLLAFVVL
ncbi:MAG: Ig-like domain-containing protein [Chlorobiaceae bacterium]|jgi:methionine-rich copper-binding protein CopC|nr:Ig-like domain-containing protein [Chlorobiaceae bacterium]